MDVLGTVFLRMHSDDKPGVNYGGGIGVGCGGGISVGGGNEFTVIEAVKDIMTSLVKLEVNLFRICRSSFLFQNLDILLRICRSSFQG